MPPKHGRQRQERNRRPANKIRKHQQCHSLGDARIVRVPRLRAADRTVHLQVASHQNQERHTVDEHQEHHVHQADRLVGRLERQTDGELAIVGDAQQRHHCHRQREQPAHDHDVAGMAQRQPLVQMHRVRDRIVALQRDDGQRVHGQLGGQHGQEAGQLAQHAHLPRYGVHAKLTQRGGVHDGQNAQVDAHEEVSGGQVADEKTWHVHFGAREDQHKDDGAVAEHGQQEHDPDAAAQRPPVEQVAARQKGTGQGQTLHGTGRQIAGAVRSRWDGFLLEVLLDVGGQVAGIGEVLAKVVPQLVDLAAEFFAEVVCEKEETYKIYDNPENNKELCVTNSRNCGQMSVWLLFHRLMSNSLSVGNITDSRSGCGCCDMPIVTSGRNGQQW